ncbi:interferon-related developmental regulator 2 isoform X9 [Bos indicus x Bos taurus]|uniref:interferon-related developmental regulator 2 isoform X9 n=1 Tax=Bos indicus x Bos taurus TaxID=30522 RepID=UPI000F7D2EFB|nr:interferon-related developmental regulator 2 isoform X9 [Bos indicus x Bos taurus]
MPRARKGSAPRRGGQRRGGGARSSTQADSGSSEDEAASEAHSTTSECASQLSAAAEEGLVPRPGRVLSRACAWPSQPVCSPTSCWSAASPWPTPWKSASRKARARSRPWPRPCWACCACRWAPAPRVRSSSTACSRCSSLCSATARPALLPGCTSAHLLSAWAATWLPRTSRILVSCLTCLEGVFSRSCSGRGSSPVVPTSLQGLLCAALQAWALLLTICPSTHIGPILDRRTLFTRTRRPSAASCALWPPTATSTGPRPTAGASAPPSGRCCTSLRAASVRRRPSASASRCSMWTAGLGAGSTPPSRMRWVLGCTTTFRTTSCSGTSSAWVRCWCWMPPP